MENRKPEKKKLLTGDTLPYLGDTLTLTVVREDRKSGRDKACDEPAYYDRSL